jgi:hypothetical protein
MAVANRAYRAINYDSIGIIICLGVGNITGIRHH